ncbi:MAG: hypothetical protein HOQ35_19610 [Acidobacteriaceae bacterium]|nr:hypothetical protein [Acidobacteriaceae bacterium]
MTTMVATAVAGRDVSNDAGEWFLTSGIRDAEGGVARFYRSDLGQNAPISTEITGYGASALISLYKQIGENRYLEAAMTTANYLVKTWDSDTETMPFECGRGAKYDSYFFDDGIIIRGLLSVWRVTRTSEFLATALRCGASMARDFFDGEHFGPILSLPEKTLAPYVSAQWSQSPGCYQLKSALGWYELWEIGKNEHHLKLYRSMLASALATHEAFLPGVTDEQKVMDRLHSYLYFLEGLLPVVHEEECADAMRHGIPKVAQYMQSIAPQFLRADVIAQLLRIRIFADDYSVLPLDSAAAEQEAAALVSFQSEEEDGRLSGGFWFGRRNGEIAPYMNPWVTSFALQALSMWNMRGRFKTDWRELI